MKSILFILIVVSSLSAGFTRSGDIVNDSSTGLAWQDNEVVKTTESTWQEAIDYCENELTLGGHSDWRLPNKKELLSIADRSKYVPAISDVFQNVSPNHYWSSTTSANYTDNAWYVYFSFGYSYYGSKDDNNYVRCVRGGQVGSIDVPSTSNASLIMYILN